MPATIPSAGVRATSSSWERRCRWAAMTRAPYSTKLPSSTRSARFSRAVRCPVWRRFSTAAGRCASSPKACRWYSSRRSARVVPSGLESVVGESRAVTSAASSTASTSPASTIESAATRTSRTTPLCSVATTCSIFIASTMTMLSPAATASPTFARTLTTSALIGERISKRLLMSPW